MGGSRRVPLPTKSARSNALPGQTRKAAARGGTAKASKSQAGKTIARGGASKTAKAGRTVARPGTAKTAKARRTVAQGAATKAASAAAKATYVYCVVRGGKPPLMATAAEPLPGGGATRVIPLAPKTWLVVANVPLKAFGQDALNKRLQDVDWMSRCGVAHQAVIESLLGSDAVVPMTLFTIFANDARALAEAKKDAARLNASLDRVAGRVEWVVRVLRGDASAAAGTVAGMASSAESPAPVMSAPVMPAVGAPVADSAAVGTSAADTAPRSGREFLQAKVDQRQAARRAAEETSQAVRALMTALSDVADDVSDRTEALAAGALGSAALLDAAFLVARTAEPRFEQAARRMAQPLADRGFRVSVTGPWPCYSFVAAQPRSSQSQSRSQARRRS